MAGSGGDGYVLLKKFETFLDAGPDGHHVAALHDLVDDLKTLQRKSIVDTLEHVVKLLGTAVGQQKDWQTPFRESGILDVALQGLRGDPDASALRTQYLRVVGNCVADNDLNREVVTQNLDDLLPLVKDGGLVTIALIVLFNLCNDFDPAKAAAAALRLDAVIIEELEITQIPEAGLDYAVDLLTWTTGKLTAEQLKDTQSVTTFSNLLNITLRYDEDHHQEYVAILVHYLQDPEFQQKICAPAILDNLVVLMLDFEARLSPSEIDAVFNELAITKTDNKPALEETSVLLLSQLINSIAGVSATDAFAQNFSVRSPVIERIRTRLAYPTDKSPSAVCACVMLGNLAMSDAICIDMVSIMQLHIPLRDILFFSTHSALLYAALGFLRHLAFPEVNRAEMGNARIIQACQRYIAMHSDDAAVRGEIAALLGKLVTNNVPNIKRFVLERVGERKGKEGELPLRSAEGPTCLEDLVAQALQPAIPLPSTAMKNFNIEAGRTIFAIFRYLARTTAAADMDVEDIRQHMFRVSNVARPVARLVRQRFYADARSEGLLGLGLMAQSSEGASRVIEEIKEDNGLLDAIKDLAEGKDSGTKQQGQTAGRDYQNAMVLLQALQNNWDDGGDALLRDRIASLQQTLGKQMV